MSQTIEAVLAHVQNLVEQLRRPDADIKPHLIIETPWETKRVSLAFDGAYEKRVLFNRDIPDFILRTKARRVIHIATAWTVTLEIADVGPIVRDEDGELHAVSPLSVPPSQDPRRSEMIIVADLTADAASTHWAKLLRSADLPPMLAPFNHVPDGQWGMALLRPIRSALRRVAGHP